MSFYESQIVPRLIHFACQKKSVRKYRERALKEAKGAVLEIGFGSGLSLPFYPPTISKLLVVEPSLTARKIAMKGIRKVRFPVEFVGLDGQKIDLPDSSIDTAVSFLSLCTIPRADQALLEIKRVLKSGGVFIFVDHGASPDARVFRWQNRLNGFQNRMCGGCNLNRKIADLIRGSALKIERLENSYISGMPMPLGYAYVGVAKKD